MMGLDGLFFHHTFMVEPEAYFFIGFSIGEADDEDVLIEQEYEAGQRSKRRLNQKIK